MAEIDLSKDNDQSLTSMTEDEIEELYESILITYQEKQQDLKSSIKNLQLELEETALKLENKESELLDSQILGTDTSAVGEDQERMKQQWMKVRDRAEDLERQLQGRVKLVAELTEELEDKISKIRLLETEVDDLKDENLDKQDQIDSFEQEQKALESQISNFHSKYMSAQEELSELENTKDEQIFGLQSQARSQLDTINSLEAKIGDLNEKIAQAESQRSQESESVVQKYVGEMEKLKASSNSEREKLKAEVEKAQGVVERKEAEIEQLKSQVEKVQNTDAQKQTEIQQLHAKLKSLKQTEEQKLKNAEEQFRGKEQEMRREIDRAKAEEDRKDRQVKEVESKLKDLEQQLSNQETEFGEKIGKMESELGQVRQQLQSKEQELLESRRLSETEVEGVKAKLEKEIEIAVNGEREKLTKEFRNKEKLWKTQTEAIVNKIKEKLARQKEKSAKLNEDLKVAKLELENVKSESEQKSGTEVQRIKEEALAESSMLNSKIHKMKTTIEEKQQEIDQLMELEIKYDSMKADYENLSKERGHLQEQFDENKAKSEIIFAALTQIATENNIDGLKLDSKDGILALQATLNDQISTKYKTQIDDLNTQLNSKEAEIMSAKSDLKAHSELLEISNSEKSKLEFELSQIDNSKFEEKIQHITEEKETLKTNLENLIEELSANNEKLRKEIKDNKDELAKYAFYC